MVQLLLDRGAEPNMVDEDGNTPQDMAERRGHKDVVQLLDEFNRPAETNLTEEILLLKLSLV